MLYELQTTILNYITFNPNKKKGLAPAKTLTLSILKMLLSVVAIIALLCVFFCSSKEKVLASVPKQHDLSPAEKMQQTIIGISAYAKSSNPDFIIVPQNGAKLAFEKGSPKLPTHTPYMAAIDAIGIEELFYNSVFEPDTARINFLRKIKDKKILVSEYIGSDKYVQDAVKRNKQEGYITFLRTKKNYNYEYIPKTVRNENRDDVTDMSKVQNYLYLINPEQYDTKEHFLNTLAKTNHDLLIIDLFFKNKKAFTEAEISRLKKKANGGKRLVICYMNIGSAEKWRYYWGKDWKLRSPSFLDRKYEGYSNEYWVKYWEPEWQQIIYGNDNSYTKKILDAGFDGAYLDNVEAYLLFPKF